MTISTNNMLELYKQVDEIGQEILGERPGDFPECQEIAHRLGMVPEDIQEVYKTWEATTKVFRAAYEILAQEKYPTRDEVCAAAHMSASRVSEPFRQWKELNPKKEALAKLEDKQISATQETPEEPEETEVNDNSPRKSLTRQQQQTELEVAQELTHRHFLKTFHQFETPGLQGDFEGAIAAIDEQYYSLNPELSSPKALAGFLIENSANMNEEQPVSEEELSETGEALQSVPQQH